MKIAPIFQQKYSFRAEDSSNIMLADEVPTKENVHSSFSAKEIFLGAAILASLGVAGAALYKNKNINKELASLQEKLTKAEKTTEELQKKLKDAESKLPKAEEKNSSNIINSADKDKSDSKILEALKNENQELRSALVRANKSLKNSVKETLEKAMTIIDSLYRKKQSNTKKVVSDKKISVKQFFGIFKNKKSANVVENKTNGSKKEAGNIREFYKKSEVQNDSKKPVYQQKCFKEQYKIKEKEYEKLYFKEPNWLQRISLKRALYKELRPKNMKNVNIKSQEMALKELEQKNTITYEAPEHNEESVLKLTKEQFRKPVYSKKEVKEPVQNSKKPNWLQRISLKRALYKELRPKNMKNVNIKSQEMALKELEQKNTISYKAPERDEERTLKLSPKQFRKPTVSKNKSGVWENFTNFVRKIFNI